MCLLCMVMLFFVGLEWRFYHLLLQVVCVLSTISVIGALLDIFLDEKTLIRKYSYMCSYRSLFGYREIVKASLEVSHPLVSIWIIFKPQFLNQDNKSDKHSIL